MSGRPRGKRAPAPPVLAPPWPDRRKLALAAIEELKRKGPGYKRDISTWGQIGQGALALGCIVAATTGHVELGLPCIISGAASSAALSVWGGQ